MMKQMRENTKIILWIVVVAFVITIFAVWGLDLQGGGGVGQQQALVGKINGEPITPQQYQSVYSQLASQFRSSAGGQLDYAEQEMIREQAWETIINNVLTTEQVKKLGISVTDQEVLSFLRDAPPAEIRQYFQDEQGNFDFAAYRAALNNPDADWTAVEALARERIPLIKLNMYLTSQVHVPRSEIRKAFEEDNTKLTVQFVRFPIESEDIAGYTPSDDEVQAWYTSHADDYTVDERAVVRYIKIPIVPSPLDRDDIDYTIRHIRDGLDSDDFGTLARTYSQAATAGVDGDTGFLVRGQRPDTLMSVVETLAKDEVSQPVWTDKGVYLVKLVDTKTEDGVKKYRMSEIFLELSAGSATTDSLMTLAQDVEREARDGDGGLSAAAAAAGITVSTSPAFAADVPVEGIGYVPALSRFAFANKVGAVSQVLGDGKNYFVCEVAERLAAGALPLDEVREDVKTALAEERKRQSALRKAEAFYRKLRGGPIEFGEAATLYGYAVERADTFTVRQPVAGMPPRSAFAYAAFNMNAGDDSPPIESMGNYYVMRVVERSPIDEAAFVQQAEAIRSRLFQRKAQEYMGYWYQSLRDKSVIEDYRDAM